MANAKKAVLARRALGILRIALLWARKGGSLKRGLTAKSILMGVKKASRASGYLEREFSFGETPAFSFRMHRPASLRMPCAGAPAVDFDEEDYDWIVCKGEDDHERNARGDYPIEDEAEDDGARDSYGEALEEEEEEDEDGIDSKAEEFIANFYEEMKMQRQMSLLRYNEMLQRGVC